MARFHSQNETDPLPRMSASEQWRDPVSDEALDKIEFLFHRARELRGQDRSTFLNQNCSADSVLRVQLESLLRHDDVQDDFLEKPAISMISASDLNSAILQAVATLKAGTNLGPYHLLQFLGQGALGDVWEADDTCSGRKVALKVLTSMRFAAPDSVNRFRAEVQRGAMFSHPRLVCVFAAECIEGFPVISMELMPGGTLQNQWQRLGKIPTTLSVDYILDIIEGLEAALNAGRVHGDVKPSNCLIGEDGRTKIGDFQIKALHWGLTEDSVVRISGYAAPEQLRGAEADFRSDIYSVGATVYNLLTGERPFEGRHDAELLARILSEQAVPITVHEAGIPRRLARIVERCLAKDPGRRYPSYEALRADLLPFSSSSRKGGLARRLAVLTRPFWL